MTESVLVSGGSGGIGSAVCRALARSGYDVLIGYSENEVAARSTGAEVGGTAIHLDLTRDESIEIAIRQIVDDERALSGVVLAASPPPVVAPLFEIPTQDFALQWQVNVEGPRRLLDGLVRLAMKPRRQGWIVGILSRAMDVDGAAKNMGSYLIAKHGQQGLLDAVKSEYPWLGVAAIRPDYTETRMLTAFDSRFIELMRARRPDGRFSTPDQVAGEIMGLIGQLS